MRISSWRRLNASRDHRWARSSLRAYVDGDLRSRQQRRLARHQELCPECHRVARTLDAMLLVLPSLQLPPQTALEVTERTTAQVRALIGEWS